MMNFRGNFVDDHPWIVSIIGAIVVCLCFAAVIGLIYFLQWLYSVSNFACGIAILFPLLVLYVRALISS